MSVANDPLFINPYEQLRGIDPGIIDALEADRMEAGHMIDPDLVRANTGLTLRVLRVAEQKSAAGKPSDSAYIDGFSDGIGISRKLEATARDTEIFDTSAKISDQDVAPNSLSLRRRLGFAAIKFLAATTGLVVTAAVVKKNRT